MESSSAIIYEYEEILLGKNEKDYKTIFEGTLNDKRKTAGVIFKYAIEHLLHWTPEQAVSGLNMDIMKKLCLDKLFLKMEIDFGVRKYSDIKEILQYAYPGRIIYDLEAGAISEYQKIAKLGEWESSKGVYRVRKGFFRGEDGRRRAGCILRYAINTYIGNEPIHELYQRFGNEKNAKVWIKDAMIPECKSLGFGSVLEFFHYSLPDNETSITYYMNEWIRDHAVHKR